MLSKRHFTAAALAALVLLPAATAADADAAKGKSRPKADLSVEKVAGGVGNRTFKPGEVIAVAGGRVANIGRAPAAQTTVTYYTTPRIGGAKTAIGEDQTVFSLKPGASQSFGALLELPTTPGTYHLGACVDAAASGSSRGNRCSALAKPFTIR